VRTDLSGIFYRAEIWMEMVQGRVKWWVFGLLNVHLCHQIITYSTIGRGHFLYTYFEKFIFLLIVLTNVWACITHAIYLDRANLPFLFI
jgi:hypothetical protein